MYKEIEDVINNAIIGENEISDNASTTLRYIRREIESKNRAVRNKLESIIRSDSNKHFLQDALVTIREDRFVVPVKSEHKSNVKGLVHDQSASGATYYIEPFAVVELNNELRELKLDEKKEIARILKIPEKIILKPPSPGLWAGQTDEGEIGLLYDTIDEILYRFDYNLGFNGLNKEDIEKVRKMRKIAEHKLKMPPMYEIK